MSGGFSRRGAFPVSNGRAPYFRSLAAIIRKDLTSEMRVFGTGASGVVIGLLATVVFGVSFEGGGVSGDSLFPGAFWIVVIFAAMTGFDRSFRDERELGALDGLLIAPVDRSAILLGKMITNLIRLALVELVIGPTMWITFGTSLQGRIVPLLLVVVGVTLGLVALGTFLGAMSAKASGGSVLLPVLFLPLALPLVLAGVNLMTSVLSGTPFGPWPGLVLAFDLIFVVVPTALFEYLVEV